MKNLNVYINRIKVDDFPQVAHLKSRHFTYLEGVNLFAKRDGNIGYEPVYRSKLEIDREGDLTFIGIYTDPVKCVVVLMKQWPFIQIHPYSCVVADYEEEE